MRNLAKLGLFGLIGAGVLAGCADQQLATGKITQQEYNSIKEKERRFLTGISFGAGIARANQIGRPDIAAGLEVAARLQAAQDSRSETNVTVNNYGQPLQETRQAFEPARVAEPTVKSENGPHVIRDGKYDELIVGTFNYSKDFDNDGFITFPEEYRGLKDYFNTGEKITVSLGSQTLIPDLSFKLLDKDGNTTDSFSTRDKNIGKVYGLNRVYNSGADDNGELRSGDYLALWYSGEELIAQWGFTVKEK